MSRLLRWQYFLPRLLAVAVALMAVHYALCLSVRHRIIRSAQTSLGVTLGLHTVHASFPDGRLVLGGFRCGDPRQPASALFLAERCDLVFDVDAYLRRGELLGHGQLTGLELFPAEVKPPQTYLWKQIKAPVATGEREAAAFRAWLADWNDQFERDWSPRYESLRRLVELSERLANEDTAILVGAKSLQQRSDHLQSLAAAAEYNPLRNVQRIRQLPADVAALQGERAALAARIERLTDLLDQGRRAVIAGRLQDEQSLFAEMPIEATASEATAAYLYSQQVQEVVAEVVGWLQWVRRVVPASGDNDQQDVPARRPTLLIESLAIEGTAQLSGRSVQLQGAMTNFTTEPWRLDQPIELHLKSHGTDSSARLEIRASIDRTGGTDRDELLVDCQGLLVPALNLGEPHGVQIGVAPSVGDLNMSLRRDGDKLSGDIQLTQTGEHLASLAGHELRSVALPDELQSLAGIRSIASRITIAGTIDDPHAAVWSTLAPAAVKALDIALRQGAKSHAQQLANQLSQRLDERLAHLDRQTNDSQARLLTELESPRSQLDQLAARYAPLKRLDVDRLGRRLPSGSLFR
jgi:hypothetical protein